MALLRLMAFASTDIRAEVGFTLLVEFVVLGGIGLVAFNVRPDNESPIEKIITEILFQKAFPTRAIKPVGDLPVF